MQPYGILNRVTKRKELRLDPTVPLQIEHVVELLRMRPHSDLESRHTAIVALYDEIRYRATKRLNPQITEPYKTMLCVPAPIMTQVCALFPDLFRENTIPDCYREPERSYVEFMYPEPTRTILDPKTRKMIP